MRLMIPVLLISSFAVAPAGAQTNALNGLLASGNAFTGLSSAATQPGLRGVGPVGIPLGSTQLETPGESPVIVPLGGTLVTGRGHAGASGIPLASTELINQGLSTRPRASDASSCTSVAPSSPSGTLPTRLFDGKGGLGTQGLAAGFSVSNCTSSALSAAQRGIAQTQIASGASGKAGIPLGASEITNNGLGGFAAPLSSAAPMSQGY
jgi:hypothetical protein